jgi:hypothetical protein
MSISKNTTVEQAVTHATEKAPDRADYWLCVWSLLDVKTAAEENDLELTDEQAQEILRYFENHYDYVWEVSWQLMSESINAILEDQKKEGVKV